MYTIVLQEIKNVLLNGNVPSYIKNIFRNYKPTLIATVWMKEPIPNVLDIQNILKLNNDPHIVDITVDDRIYKLFIQYKNTASYFS